MREVPHLISLRHHSMKEVAHIFSKCSCGSEFCNVICLIGTDYFYIGNKTWWHPDKEGVDKKVTFEHVLDNIPKEIQVQLLFHLNLFT